MVKVNKPPQEPKTRKPKPPFWKFFYPTGSIAEKDGYYWQLQQQSRLVHSGMHKIYYREWVRITYREFIALYWEYYLNGRHFDG